MESSITPMPLYGATSNGLFPAIVNIYNVILDNESRPIIVVMILKAKNRALFILGILSGIPTDFESILFPLTIKGESLFLTESSLSISIF
jgi:hypothetical protein